jgi:hypothetical protein
MYPLSTGLLPWVQALGLPTLVVGLLAYYVGRWQINIARENQRRDQYDRRFAIYMSFHELMLAMIDKPDPGPDYRKANAMRAQALFLLNPALGSYLESLLTEASRIIQQAKLVHDSSAWSSQQKQAQAGAEYVRDRLVFNSRIDELAEHFVQFLRMKE